MTADRARLRRLQRLERIRAIAKDQAAREAAEAEGTLAQLTALAERTRELAGTYAARGDLRDGFALSQLHRFVAGLDGISASTSSDAVQAQASADAKQLALAQAERRRSAVEARAEAQARRIAAQRQAVALGARRASGTGLEQEVREPSTQGPAR
jgi:hypothetical protein